MDTYLCLNCNQLLPRTKYHESLTTERPVQLWCIQCFKQYRFKHRYPQCQNCKIHKPLNSNNICKKCNAQQGLKECNKCHEILLHNTSFYKDRGICIKCKQIANRLYQASLKD
jgi:hypothetical protein